MGFMGSLGNAMAAPFKATNKAIGKIPGVQQVAGTMPGMRNMFGQQKPQTGIGPTSQMGQGQMGAQPQPQGSAPGGIMAGQGGFKRGLQQMMNPQAVADRRSRMGMNPNETRGGYGRPPVGFAHDPNYSKILDEWMSKPVDQQPQGPMMGKQMMGGMGMGGFNRQLQNHQQQGQAAGQDMSWMQQPGQPMGQQNNMPPPMQPPPELQGGEQMHDMRYRGQNPQMNRFQQMLGGGGMRGQM